MISLCCCMNYPSMTLLQVPKQILMWRSFQDFQASQQSKNLRKSGFFSFLLFSFPRHCMVKSQNYWLFKECEGKFVKDKQICHSECCPGEKKKKIKKSTSTGNLKFIFLFWNDFIFWNFTWNRDLKGLPIQASVVIQLLLIHKINNVMSCFLILRSLSSIYHYPSS